MVGVAGFNLRPSGPKPDALPGWASVPSTITAHFNYFKV